MIRLASMVICGATVTFAIALAVAPQSPADPSFSQLASERAVLERTTLPGFVTAVRPQVAAIMRSDRTTWAKATAVRDLLRAAAPIKSGDCSDYSLWFLALVRPYRLQVRMVAGSLNMLNAYDTHTTVSVWLPARRRWVIVDPTFGGEFTVHGRAVGAYDLQRLILAGRTNLVHWRSSHGKNATMPSDYYVDPVLLFRYVAVYGELGGKLAGIANHDSLGLGELAGTTLNGTEPPDVPIRVKSAGDKRPGELSPDDPPWYTTQRVSSSYRGPVVLVGDRRFDYRGRGSKQVDGRWVSPIAIANGGLPTGVKAFAVPRFPASHES
jgi:Transglutaminase-like superfamily